jgi:MFS family permease
VAESRAPGEERGFDVAGAITVTAGNALLVYGISRAPVEGWGSWKTIVPIVVAAALLVAFVWIEGRTRNPLMPLSIFRVATVAGANAVALLLGAVVFSNFLLLTLYVQDILHYSALKTGVTFLATAGTVVIVAGAAQALTTRFGSRPVLVVGMLLLAAGMLWYSQIPVHGSYGSDLLPGYLLVGFGLAAAFIPVSIAALAGVGPKEAGLASGMINTSQQIGGAIGVAVAISVATSHTKHLLKTGDSVPAAITGGYAIAFWVMAGISLAGAALAFVLVRVPRERLEEAGAGAPIA